MKKITALVVSFLMAIVAVRYCYLITIGEIQPVLATWALFSIAVSVGMWTYIKSESGKKDLVTNVANTADIFVTWSIFIFILFFGKNTRYEFTHFEIGCILASVATLLYWKISKRANAANIAINVILVIGYFPTIKWLWNSPTNTESFAVWIIVLIASITALYNPIKEKDWLAAIYASRSTILVSIILWLMLRKSM